jgi:hypothetical protein
MALWSRAKAEHATSRVVKTAPVIIVVEYVLMISFQGLPFSGRNVYISEGRAHTAPFSTTATLAGMRLMAMTRAARA